MWEKGTQELLQSHFQHFEPELEKELWSTIEAGLAKKNHTDLLFGLNLWEWTLIIFTSLSLILLITFLLHPTSPMTFS